MVTDMSELRIGIPDQDRALAALREADELRARLAAVGAELVWVPYGDGLRTIDLLPAGDVHVAATGLVPPLRAQSEGVEVAYLAVREPQVLHARVAVRAGSTVDSLEALRGRRVALERGSAAVLALSVLLERAGVVTYRDVEPVLLPAPLARRALLDGHVEAWLDHLGDAPLGSPIRALPGAAVDVADRTVWIARRDIAATAPALVDALVTTVCGADPQTARVTRGFLAEQQRLGDLLAGQGAIGLPVNLGVCALEAA